MEPFYPIILKVAVRLDMLKLGGPLDPIWLNIAVRFPIEKFPPCNPDGGENGLVIFKLKFDPFPNPPRLPCNFLRASMEADNLAKGSSLPPDELPNAPCND